MKRILLIITILLTNFLSFAQIPKEAFDLTNSLSSLWRNNETQKAIENSIELYKLYPPFLVNNIHNSLAQQITNDLYEQNAFDYITKIYQQNNADINKLIAPIRQWSLARRTNDPKELETIISNLNKLLDGSDNFTSKPERYCLLTLGESNVQKTINEQLRKELLLKVINNLLSYKYISENATGRSESEVRAWHRYLLAYSYYFLYSKFDNKEEYILNASLYSPDSQDKLVKHAYFYDAALLTGNTQEVGYKAEYLTFLKQNNRKNEALDILTDMAFVEPTDNNLKLLKTYFSELNPKADFNNYWLEYINSMCKETPKVKIDFSNEKLDLSQKNTTWIYIDVWGTWCSPCVRELPKLQSFFVDNNKDINSKLKIYTFSYGSQNLSTFLTENNYTFPVSEIDKEVNDSFEISSYPTKILITPNGKYLKIPFNTDWKMYIKNYIQM